jgi:hypothetical protein
LKEGSKDEQLEISLAQHRREEIVLLQYMYKTSHSVAREGKKERKRREIKASFLVTVSPRPVPVHVQRPVF